MFSLLLIASVLVLARAKTVRRGDPAGWVERRDIPIKDEVFQFRLALFQQNIDVLEKEVLKRSDPDSSKYAQWMTTKEVLDLVAPEDSVLDLVAGWAKQQGLQVDASGRDVVVCEGSIDAVEDALKTKLSVWQHTRTKEMHVRALEYSLPDEIHEHVEMLTGLYEFWTLPKGGRTVAAVPTAGGEEDNVLSKRNNVAAGYVIPDTLRGLYSIPKDSYRTVSKKSSVCAAEFEDNARFSHRDLRYFDQQTGEHHQHVNIIGPWHGAYPNAESQLDIEYASTLALNSTYYYWTATKWMMEFAQDVIKHHTKPDVISMSWGWPSDAQCQITQCQGITSQQYVKRVDVEWLKLTAHGVTLVAASGDQGAPGDGHSGCNGLSDIYPGSSPWVLSVGATMLNPKGPHKHAPANPPPVCSSFACSTVTQEIVCSWPAALITTGGGFSSYTSMPSYQKPVVQAYLNNKGITFPPKGSFNPNNRAFPDVSAIGHAVLIGINGRMTQVDGTSCSAPEVAAMIALLNGWRKNNNKGLLGFINPMMYKAHASNPNIFIDITVGNNKCTEGCCSQKYGFEATTGWDATTGLGSIHFPKLLNYVKTLK